MKAIDGALQRVLERGLEHLVSDEEFRRWEARQGERDRRDRLEASAISQRLDERGMSAILTDQARDTKALRMVRAWVASSRPALVLLGDPGRGKTVAAAWALARVAGRYVTEQQLCEMRKGEWRTRKSYETHLCTELLVIDELGRERDADLALQVMLDVIDARQRLPRRTLLLGNAEKELLIERYDRASLDRLGLDSDEAGIAIVRYLRGESLRKAQR